MRAQQEPTQDGNNNKSNNDDDDEDSNRRHNNITDSTANKQQLNLSKSYHLGEERTPNLGSHLHHHHHQHRQRVHKTRSLDFEYSADTTGTYWPVGNGAAAGGVASVESSARTLCKLKRLIKVCARLLSSGAPTCTGSETSINGNNNSNNQEAAARRRADCHQAPAIDRDVDGGYAWIILMVMFVINASTFGTARAYGLIFERLAREDDQSRAQAALPFTIMGAVENMGGPLTGYLLARTHSWCLTVFVGSCLITLAHLLAAYFTTLVGQILTIGLMCGLGQSFVTISSFQINNAYFVRYRSRAFGLGLTGAAIGALYISPICQLVLDRYDTNLCYLLLGFILLPNVPLSLLLRSKRHHDDDDNEQIGTISARLDHDQAAASRPGLWQSIRQVISRPLFHLIWPTQLLFCWLNFVFGMIIVDFGKDRSLDSGHVARLIPIWAFGQLVGRLLLGSLVDLKLVSYKLFTVICFFSISVATWALSNVRDERYEPIIIPALVFVLSMFISTLYILFNGLVVKYMDRAQTALAIGISSFAGSFFLLPRATIIGYYRDTTGNYDAMLDMFAYISMAAALVWLLMPGLFTWLSPRCPTAASWPISKGPRFATLASSYSTTTSATTLQATTTNNSVSREH